jgi:phthalate 4,5-dioxygenase oxygenase subunit
VGDTSCWIYTYSWRPDRAFTNSERAQFDGGFGVHSHVDDDYMPLRNVRNEYQIDRKAQKNESFTGITGVSEQDSAIQDSQGPIQDRTREHLGPTDVGIVEFRKLVMGSARALQQGNEPKSTQVAKKYAVRSGASVADPSKDLSAVMTERFGHRHGYVGNEYGLGE